MASENLFWDALKERAMAVFPHPKFDVALNFYLEHTDHGTETRHSNELRIEVNICPDDGSVGGLIFQHVSDETLFYTDGRSSDEIAFLAWLTLVIANRHQFLNKIGIEGVSTLDEYFDHWTDYCSRLGPVAIKSAGKT